VSSEGFWVVILFGFLLGFVVGHVLTDNHYTNLAVEKGYAEYNQTNGNWQWKTPHPHEVKE